jgi:hypothetical protein
MQLAKNSNNNVLAKEISTKYSTHLIVSAFYDLGVVDVYEKLTHENLHNNSLGVTRLVLKLIEKYLNKILKPKQLKAVTKELNLRLVTMDR